MMTSSCYSEFERACRKKGYVPMNVEALCRVVKEATIYKFKRSYMTNWQYEVYMPGYGKLIDKSKWTKVKIIGNN
jgi:hypothetical protein